MTYIERLQDKSKKFNEENLRIIMHDLILSYKDIHHLDQSHNDIKPENIVIDNKGVCKLIDFGFADLTHENREDNEYGTEFYASPEKIWGKTHDTYKADMYCIGLVMYLCIFQQHL